MKRSLKLSLMNSNSGKILQLNSLWNEYQKIVNDFIKLWFQNNNALTESFLKSYPSILSYRYKQCAKRQAFKIIKAWCRAPKKGKEPELTKPSMILDQRFLFVDMDSTNSFDIWIKLSTKDSGIRIDLPAKSYKYLDAYFKTWNLVPGGRLTRKDNGGWFVTLTFEKEATRLKTHNKKIGIDVGYRKLIATSDKKFYGIGFTKLVDKAVRKKKNSKGENRVREEIKNYINRSAKDVFNDNPSVIVLEDLCDLKKNKKAKTVNNKFRFWYYPLITQRIEQLCEVVGVQCHKVDPKYTSQTCPLCGHIEKLNRKDEVFKCIKCDFSEDADYVGAINILSRFTQEPIVPVIQNPS
jgi:IS605 OrfB family transposase